jgi:hypothetical protein
VPTEDAQTTSHLNRPPSCYTSSARSLARAGSQCLTVKVKGRRCGGSPCTWKTTTAHAGLAVDAHAPALAGERRPPRPNWPTTTAHLNRPPSCYTSSAKSLARAGSQCLTVKVKGTAHPRTRFTVSMSKPSPFPASLAAGPGPCSEGQASACVDVSSRGSRRRRTSVYLCALAPMALYAPLV